MAACLPANASAADAAQRLRRWQRAAESHWGGAQAADILPGDGVTEYDHSEALPVAAELEQQIRALR